VIGRIIEWSARNRTFILLATLFIVGAGVWAVLSTPLDAIPDIIPVLGWTDDTAVLLWFITGLVRESGRFVSWESDYPVGRQLPPKGTAV